MVALFVVKKDQLPDVLEPIQPGLLGRAPYLLEKAPRCLLNFSTYWCGAYFRMALIQEQRLFKKGYFPKKQTGQMLTYLIFVCS